MTSYFDSLDQILPFGFIKTGATLSFTVNIRDESNDTPLTNATDKLRCHGKYKGSSEVLTELTIVETSEPGTYALSAPAVETATWTPNREIYFDIAWTGDGEIVAKTKTFSILVEESVTE